MIQLWSAAKGIAQTTWTICKTHSSGIFTGAGIAGYLLAVPLAVKGSRKFDQYKEDIDFSELTTTGKCRYFIQAYWPTGVALVGATLCVLVGHHNLAKNVDALGEALMLSTAHNDELKESIQKVAGEKKAKLIEEDATKSFCEKELAKGTPTYDSLDPDNTGGLLFIDALHGTKFRSTFEAVREAYRKFNLGFDYGLYTDRGSWQYDNELRFLLGLPDVKAGDIIGWNWESVSDSDGLQPRFLEAVQYDGVTYIPVLPSVVPFERPYD